VKGIFKYSERVFREQGERTDRSLLLARRTAAAATVVPQAAERRVEFHLDQNRTVSFSANSSTLLLQQHLQQQRPPHSASLSKSRSASRKAKPKAAVKPKIKSSKKPKARWK
jgi:hypothetical protein